MKRNDAFTKLLAVVGSLLAWFPLLMPVLFSLGFLFVTGRFRFDYLMPAELFLFALAGGGLLLWASLRTGTHRGMIGWGIGLAAGLLAGGQALAVVTGLASGETEPTGVWWILVLASLAFYILALMVMAVGGLLLLRDLFRSPPSSIAGGQP